MPTYNNGTYPEVKANPSAVLAYCMCAASGFVVGLLVTYIF